LSTLFLDNSLGGSGQLNKGQWFTIPEAPDNEVSEPHMRFKTRVLPVEERCDNFREVDLGFHKLDAMAEALRCLHCDKR